MKRFLILISVIVISLGYVAFEAIRMENKLEGFAKMQTGTVLTQLPQVSFLGFDKKSEVSLYQLAESGKKIVIHFWATWCGPCEKELPELFALTELMKPNKDIVFIFVTVNDEKKKVIKFLDKYKKFTNYILVVDDENIHQNTFGTFRLPETFVFNNDKSIVRKFIGAQKWSQSAYVQYLNSI